MIEKLKLWIEDRTGLVSFVEGFFDEEIPASSGWHQVFIRENKDRPFCTRARSPR